MREADSLEDWVLFLVMVVAEVVEEDLLDKEEALIIEATVKEISLQNIQKIKCLVRNSKLIC
jgi:hypothetical protein